MDLSSRSSGRTLLGRTLPAIGRRAALVALGDSNTTLPSLQAYERWPERVGRQLGMTIKIVGRDGSTLQDAYDRGLVDRALTTGAPYLTVGFAVDSCLSLSVSEFSGLLDQLLYQVETTPTTPLLLTGVWLDYPPDVPTGECDAALKPFNTAIRSAAAERAVRLLDIAARMEKQSLRSEADPRLPLSVAGSRLIAHLVVQAMRTVDRSHGRRGLRAVPAR